MKKSAQLWYLVLLIPFFYESIDHKLPTLSYGPFTIGRFVFIIAGLLLLFQYPNERKNSNVYNGVMIMLFGNIIGGILMNDLGSVSRTILFILLITGALGITTFFATSIGRNALIKFFIVSFIYWVKYIFDRMFSGGSINTYSSLFLEGEAVNHHVAGINVSIAGLFTSIFFYYKNNNMQLLGYFGIGLAAIACFLSESRSNTLFTIIGFVILLIIQKKNMSMQLLIIFPFIFLTYLVVNYLLEGSETLAQRFDIYDTDYQERTTGMRLDMIYEAFNQLGQHPAGKGIRNVYVNIGGRNLNIHNQYISYIIGGGLIGLIGVIVWLRQIYFNFQSYLNIGRIRLQNDSFYMAIAISTLVLHITLFTLEYTSLLFFLIISLSILFENKINEEQRRARLENRLK